MSLNDYVHLAIAEEAQRTLKRNPGELSQAFDRRLDRYIHQRLKEIAQTMIAIDRERHPDPEVA